MRGHEGRIIKFMGDGVLMEFASAVNAVTAALELQDKMAEANALLSEDRRILLRIGINLGDIIGEGADVFGDDVNIAARLEALADPEGSASRPRFAMKPTVGSPLHSTTWARRC